mgnify:CR=1 FL=1
MESVSSSIAVEYTNDLKCPHRKKSIGLRSDELGGQALGPKTYPINQDNVH